MQGRQFDVRTVDAGPPCHELQQGKRILSAGEADEDAVAFVQQAVVGQAFAKMPPDAAFQELGFGGRGHQRKTK